MNPLDLRITPSHKLGIGIGAGNPGTGKVTDTARSRGRDSTDNCADTDISVQMDWLALLVASPMWHSLDADSSSNIYFLHVFLRSF